MSNMGTPAQQPDPHNNPDQARAAGNPKRRQIIALTVLLVVSAAFFGFTWYSTRSQAVNAKVGQCMASAQGDSITIVSCSDPKAAYLVVGRVENKTRSEAGYLSTVCDAYQDKGADTMFWHGEQNKKGYVLCLAKHTP